MPQNGRPLRNVSGAVGQPVRVPKMAELVASDLRGRIIKGELSEGDALPSEPALMQQFGVSRPTLREAFRVLESESLIEVRRGAGGGGRVRAPSLEVAARYAGMVLQHRGTTLRDVWEARLVLEPPTAAMLARRRTKADLAKLEEALADHGAADDPATRVEAHSAFHDLVVQLAGNDTLALLNAMLADIVHPANRTRVVADQGTDSHDRAYRLTMKSHRLLVDHIAARDAAKAEDLWRRHLSAGSAYLLEADGPTSVLNLLP